MAVDWRLRSTLALIAIARSMEARHTQSGRDSRDPKSWLLVAASELSKLSPTIVRPSRSIVKLRLRLAESKALFCSKPPLERGVCHRYERPGGRLTRLDAPSYRKQKARVFERMAGRRGFVGARFAGDVDLGGCGNTRQVVQTGCVAPGSRATAAQPERALPRRQRVLRHQPWAFPFFALGAAARCACKRESMSSRNRSRSGLDHFSSSSKPATSSSDCPANSRSTRSRT